MVIWVVTADGGYDEVDNCPPELPDTHSLCSYLVIDSRDQLSVNLTPHALDVLTEVADVSLLLITGPFTGTLWLFICFMCQMCLLGYCGDLGYIHCND